MTFALFLEYVIFHNINYYAAAVAAYWQPIYLFIYRKFIILIYRGANNLTHTVCQKIQEPLTQGENVLSLSVIGVKEENSRRNNDQSPTSAV